MDHGTYPWCGFRRLKMKHIKYYNGVPMKLSTPKGRVRTLQLKDGHQPRRACISTVQVGMIEFHSEHQAKRFIKALGK